LANESLGITSCEACNGDAHIKRRSNGKKLLYLHCKSCGLDQRSGKILQARWQAIVEGDQQLPEQIKPPLKTDEWQPAEVQQNERQENENTDQNHSTTSNSGIKWLAGLAIGLVGIIGFRAGA
jgi:hypothetical protein